MTDNDDRFLDTLYSLTERASSDGETSDTPSEVKNLLRKELPEETTLRARRLDALMFKANGNDAYRASILPLLLQIRCQSPSIRGEYGRTALEMAILFGDVKMIDRAIVQAERFSGGIFQNGYARASLLNLISWRQDSSDRENILRLLSNFVLWKPRSENDDGRNAAHVACLHGDFKAAMVTLEFLERKSPGFINLRTTVPAGSTTCLHLTVQWGDSVMTRWLLEHGASTDMEDASGNDAWSMCCALIEDVVDNSREKYGEVLCAMLYNYSAREFTNYRARYLSRSPLSPQLTWTSCDIYTKFASENYMALPCQVYIISANNDCLIGLLDSTSMYGGGTYLAARHLRRTFREGGNRYNGLIYREPSVIHYRCKLPLWEAGQMLEKERDIMSISIGTKGQKRDFSTLGARIIGGKGMHEVHLPLTLDEYCNTALNSNSLYKRNYDQVLVRYLVEQENLHRGKNPSPLAGWTPAGHTRLLMVHHIWIDVLPKGIVIAFPEAVAEDKEVKGFLARYSQTYRNAEPYEDATAGTQMLHAAELLSTFIRLLEMSNMAGLSEPVLNIFQKSITQISEQVEKDFGFSSRENQRRLADRERKLFHDISDVREELAMIGSVVFEQAEVWLELARVMETNYHPTAPTDARDTMCDDGIDHDIIPTTSRYLQKLQRRIEKLDKDAARVQILITQVLEMKRSYSGIREAHWTAMMGVAVFIFTAVTVIFTPLSVVFSLLAVPRDSILVGPADDKTGLVRDWAGSMPNSVSGDVVERSGGCGHPCHRVVQFIQSNIATSSD
ncbi:ankyrin repeat-containing domain [Cordyceps militaris CM01]|uniref:Ankyrin repeat-containing domain n=1 Tax=Cordyceps militaris (strain CM01) TaxID=983644 RepID=G3JS12_CORMM|nr:ankyrin repeat-containing domain [Cordyceps militaris CM01]EGX88658.1 ankyrin repeat-containing domain [Cordyceps militaris CM01]